MHLFAKRFKERGHDVEIVIPRATENHRSTPLNFETQGEYEGIPFRYSVNPVRSNSFIKRRWTDFTAYFKTIKYLIKTKRDSDIVMAMGINLDTMIACKIFCMLFNCKFVWEKNELPFVFTEKNAAVKIYHIIFEKYVLKIFDGIISISDSLHSYFKDKAGDKTMLLIIPILTDTSVFVPTRNNSGEIVYAGRLNQFKDGIFDLLNAYQMFSKNNPGRKLVLMGDINLSSNKDEINKYIEANGLQDKIEITGYVSREAMIERMNNAAVLVLAKPSNLQAEHCVPTKIAEYLSTGKPVLTTYSGSIPQFLTNEKDSYLTEPDNPVKLAEALDNIFNDYHKAEIVGIKGRQLAQDQFEYTRQGDKVLLFFSDLLQTA